MKKTDTKEKKSFDINNSTAAIEKDEAHKEINGNGKSVDSHLKQESKFADQSADNTLYKYQNENIEYFRHSRKARSTICGISRRLSSDFTT